MANKIWLNEKILNADENHIHHSNTGFTTGIGIFDSLLCIDGAPQFIEDHYQRIKHDTAVILRQNPTQLSLSLFQDTIQTLLNKNNLEEGTARIRTSVTGGMQARPLAAIEDLQILISSGVAVPSDQLPPIEAIIITDYPRIAGCLLENCKRIDYSRSYAARMDAIKKGGNEAILTNTKGHIACGATSNIFIEENDTLITPPLSEGVLAGVTRKNILKTRKSTEEIISIERLLKADNVYLTNSFIGLQPIKVQE